MSEPILSTQASPSEVLVVGAGPTGLFFALLLARFGVSVRIVDTAAEPGTTSRALAVQARTLELYQQVGLAKEVLARGLQLSAVNLWNHGKRVAHVALTEVGEGVSPFPFGVIFPQDEHERLLIAHLEKAGVVVERRTTIHTIEQAAGHVMARGERDGAAVTFEAKVLAGCDGARSVARKAIGAAFPGGTYDHVFYVADVIGRGAPMDKELHVLLDAAGFLGVFPLAGDGRARVIGTIREEREGSEAHVTWDDVDRAPIERIGLVVERVNWFSTYRVHHRVADTFRRGNVFLLGDAGHIHSPVGGQGMNTGLGDAMNLGWKLAAVLRSRARADLLDTYEPERIAFARRLVATTDRVFQAASSETKLAEVMRTEVIPRLLPHVVGARIGQHVLFAAVSQTGITYRDSAWSEGKAGTIHAGDRLPWVPGEGDDNFVALTALEWQAHCYGDAPPGVAEACRAHRIGTHVFPWTRATEGASLRQETIYLVRPDGYVGGVFSDAAALTRYLDEHAIHGA